MPAIRIPRPLRELAALYGVLTQYRERSGRLHRASPESILAVLRAMGAPIERIEDVDDALHQRRRELLDCLCPPVAIAPLDRAGAIDLHLSEHELDQTLQCELTLESGEQSRFTINATALHELECIEHDGRRWIVKRLQLRDPLPMGYHILRFWIGARSAALTLLSAPRRFYEPPNDSARRELGLFAPWYALHSEESWGVGDLGDLRQLMQWTGQAGCSIVGTLPMLATFLDEPFDPSPYSPVSKLFWNELALDVPHAARRASLGEFLREIEDQSFHADRQRARSGALIDYRLVAQFKRRTLEALADRAYASDALRDELERFARGQPELEAYASFRAATLATGKTWHDWPQAMRDGRLEPGDFDERIRRYHVFVQWLLHRELEALSQAAQDFGTALYLDLPVGVHPAGFDAWRWQAQFAIGAAVGAPADASFPRGQNWGFPPPHPHAMRADGHRYFIASIRNHLRYAKFLRIDHVMGLHRLYWIPHGMDAGAGVYVRYPAQEHYAILAIETHRQQARIIGENLGVVPPQCNRDMARFGALGMEVGMYELERGIKHEALGIRGERGTEHEALGIRRRGTTQRTADPSAQCLMPHASPVLACLNTHDMPTFAAFWTGKDIDLYESLGFIDGPQAAAARRDRAQLRKRLGPLLAREAGREDPKRITTRLACEGALAMLARSRAKIVLVNIEDLWQETQLQNVPGTCDEHPNWRRRLAYSLEAIRSKRSLKAMLRRLHELRGAHRDAAESTHPLAPSLKGRRNTHPA